MTAQHPDEYVIKRYEDAIKYYWRSSKLNKRAYKLTRSLTVILGATVTLVASLSSAKFIASSAGWTISFAIATPVLAAVLTIVGGFSQAFHWGAAWNDMVLYAERLEKERDRFMVTDSKDREPAKEVAILGDLVLEETRDFFQRVIGGEKAGKEEPQEPGEPTQ
jgi:hypothetical protein